MVAANGAPKNYDEAVERLAQEHMRLPESERPQAIYFFPDPAGQIVRLLEVTSLTPASGEVMPIPLAPSADFPFRSRIAEVTPDEWSRIESGQILMPEGWDLGRKKRLWPL